MMVNDMWANPQSQSIFFENKKVARLRFINMSAFVNFHIWLGDSYMMQVIEVDGVKMDGSKLFRVLEINAGQRISVLIARKEEGALDVASLRIELDPHLYKKSQVSAIDGKTPSDVCWPKTINPVIKTKAELISHKFGWNALIAIGSGTQKLRDASGSSIADPVGDFRKCFPFLSSTQCSNTADNAIFPDYDDLLLVPKDPDGGTWIPSDVQSYRFIQTQDHKTTVSGDTTKGRAEVKIHRLVPNDPWGFTFWRPLAISALFSPFVDDQSNDWTSVITVENTLPRESNTIFIPDSFTKWWIVIQSLTGEHPCRFPLGFNP